MAANADDDESWLYGGKDGDEANQEVVDPALENNDNTVKQELTGEADDLPEGPLVVKEEPVDMPMEVQELVGTEPDVTPPPPGTDEVKSEMEESAAAEEDGQPQESAEAQEDDDDEEEDDVQVTIGEVKASYDGTPKFKGPYQRPATKPAAKGVDLDAVGTINETPVFEFDIDSLNAEDKPWRKPGADITDYFNYGFNEDTWKQYCEKQRRLRIENNSGMKIFMPSKPYERMNQPPPRPPPMHTEFMNQRLEAMRHSNIPSLGSQTTASINVIGSRRPDASFFPEDTIPFSSQSGGTTPPPPGVQSTPDSIAASLASSTAQAISSMLTSLPPPQVSVRPPVMLQVQGPPNMAIPPPGMNIPPPGMNVPPPGMRVPPPNMAGPPPSLASNVAQMVLAAGSLFRPPPNMQGPPPNMQNFPPFGPPPGPGGPPPIHRGPPPGFHGERPNFNFPPPQTSNRYPAPRKRGDNTDWMNLPLSDDDLSGSDEDERRMKRERDRDGATRDVRETSRPRRDRSRSRSRERRSHRDGRHRSRRERDSREHSRRHDSPSKGRESSRSHRSSSRRDGTPPAPPSSTKVTNMTEVPAS